MERIRRARLMQDAARTALLKGKSLGFVPTMGALHEGHLSLVRSARQDNDLTAVSIFVNPAQFNGKADFDAYPRNIDADIAALDDAGVDIIFLPELAEVYPQGFATAVSVSGIADRLCGAHRPGHFAGVATVVAKLFNMVLPRRAYFGLKDYQQWLVVKRLAEDLNYPVEIIACPTRREADGLAMSSRNQRLTPEERAAAPAIYRALSEAAARIKSGGSPAEAATLIRQALEAEPLITRIDYAGAYHPGTLSALTAALTADLTEFQGRALLAAAVHMGPTRLIDNVIV